MTVKYSVHKRFCWLALVFLAGVSPVVSAAWYSENVASGADIVSMEMRYPHWTGGIYYSCWNMSMVPKGGSFYGGVD